jgi:large subunit ribosomal protein L18
MDRLEQKISKRVRRRARIRKRISGTAERPRLTVFRSNRYTYVQAIDDVKGQTLCAASNLSKDSRAIRNTMVEVGKLGELIGSKLKEKGVQSVVFDRNGYRYHGIVKAIADGARKAGMKF